MCKHVENEIVIYKAPFSNILYFNKKIYCTELQRLSTRLKLKIIDKGLPQFYNIFLQPCNPESCPAPNLRTGIRTLGIRLIFLLIFNLFYRIL